MPVGQAVLLIPPPQFPTSCKNAAKSFICHRSENSPVSPLLATLPKTPLCKSFVCHTSDTPRGPQFVSRPCPSAPQRLCAIHLFFFPSSPLATFARLVPILYLLARHSPLPPALSYTRRIKFTQGFVHDHSRSLGSCFQARPQRAQRRNRRQAQEISLALGHQLLPAASGRRPRRDAIPLGPRRQQVPRLLLRHPHRFRGPLQSQGLRQSRRAGEPPAAHFHALSQLAHRGARGKSRADHS